ncbi:HNH endonuclease [Pseudomonas sp. NFACC37-1]|uniref:HNH endonuclease n=1 Tax=Pseudomonas sp. NFACC37-1 TaxID=1566196 RepID=UPI000884FC83|nr:HNH endonuclease signature motif containing protein [Pseudomonas sp. NFACC37-1]SCY81766.1 HNH endonuclease [Pseudomonas sp. NFACC37-1]
MLEAKFYETYYFCNIIKNILHYPDDYLRKLNAFYGDGTIYYRLGTFRKYSALHELIEFIIEDVYYEQADEKFLSEKKALLERFRELPILLRHMRPCTLPIERALEYHQMTHQSFEAFLDNQEKHFTDCNADDVYEYILELRESGIFELLIEHITKEVFHVLFQNRELVKVFNIMMADALEREEDSTPPVEIEELFSKPGILKRVAIPKWVRRAVFYRDRGRCVLCDKDLSGQVNLENQENYDHIVPLAKHGLNDVSNIQLLCKECNQNEKRAGEAVTSNKYQSWYKY